MEDQRDEVAAEKESAGPTIAPEQLREGKKGKSYGKMLLKCGLTKLKDGRTELRTENDESIPFTAAS